MKERSVIVMSLVFGAVIFALTGLTNAQGVPAPSTFTASVRSACTVDLAWSPVSSADTYEVQYTTDESFFLGGDPVVNTADTAYVDEGLDAGVSYRYRVRTRTPGNQSAWKLSEPNVATTLALPAAPAAPTAFTATGRNTPGFEGREVDLAWESTSISEYGGFVVERALKTQPNDWTVLATLPSTFRAYRDGVPLLNAATVYRYRVRSFESAFGCDSTNRSYSDYTGIAEVATRPTGLSASYEYNPNSQTNQINLSWTKGNGHAYQEVERMRSDESGFTTVASNVPPGTQAWSDTTVATNSTYTYRVRGCTEDAGAQGCSSYTNTATASVSNAPQNFRLLSQAAGGSGGIARFEWSNTFPNNNYEVRRVASGGAIATFTVAGPNGNIATVSFSDSGVPLGDSYTYSVRSDFGGLFSDYSTAVNVNFRITSVKGWFWSSTGPGTGLGWGRLSNDSIPSAWDHLGANTAAPDAEPFGVFVDDAGALSGYAWSSYGGWLSFGETSGCPSGGCGASVDLGTGAVSGWAKLGTGTWVSLSQKSGEPPYGLRYETTAWSSSDKALTGYAWGGDGIGWVAFSGLRPPDLVTAEDAKTETSLTLRWDNPEDYESLTPSFKQSIETNFSEWPSGVITDPNLVSTGSNKTLVFSNLLPGTSYDFYLEATKGADSAISLTKRGTTLAPGQAAGYTFICRATSDSNILLSWVGSSNVPHTLEVRGGTDTATSTYGVLATRSAGSGSFEHSGLSAGATRYYQLRVNYTDATPDVYLPADPASCTTLSAVPQDPEGLQVAPLGPTSLYVTWKDNATRPHNFILERIKVTPSTSTAVTAEVSGGNDVLLAWANDTNTQTFRSPYYHVVERSPSVNFVTFTSSTVAFSDDMRYTASTTDYGFTDVNVPQGTFYYRVKACSFIKVDYDRNGSLDEVCAAPTVANGGAPVTVVRAAPSSVVASVAERVSGFFSRLFGSASAQVELVNGAQIDLNTYFQQFRAGNGGVLTFAANPGVYRDNNLTPNTVYLYRAKTVYTDAAGGETSYTNEGAAKTLSSGATDTVQVKVCVRNNLCGTASGLRGGAGDAPVNQCNVNADCRNVGTTRQFFEER